MELPKYIRIVLVFIAGLVLVNVLLLDFFFVRQRSDFLDFQARLVSLTSSFQTLGSRLMGSDFTKTSPTTTPAPALTTDQLLDAYVACPQSCVYMINSATRSGVAATRQTVIAPTATTPTTVSTKGEYFIQLGTGSVNSGDATGSNWKTIDSAQATFDAGSYGSIKSATLEITMHINSGGTVHARLLDATTPAVFWTAELSTTSTTPAYLSGPIALSGGSKTYKIQMYSEVYTGYLDQARIHIVTQ